MLSGFLGNYTAPIQVLSNLATIISIVFIAYQAYIVKKDYKLKNIKDETEKSIVLSKFYIDEIIPRMTYLYTVLGELKIDNIISDVKYEDMKQFDTMELNNLFKKDVIEEIKNKTRKIDMKILIKARSQISDISMNEFKNNILAVNLESCLESDVAVTEEEENEKIKVIKGIHIAYHRQKYNNEFNRIMCEIKNLLEYFCMNFNTGIANEEIVYQSLHQSFLKCIRLLYYWIASINSTGKDKYYTNIITLYNKWSEKYCKQCEQEAYLTRSTVQKQKIIKR